MRTDIIPLFQSVVTAASCRSSYYVALQPSGVVTPTALGLLVPAGIVAGNDNRFVDELKVFFCPIDTSRILNEPSSDGGTGWIGTATRLTYMQNPHWRWGDLTAPATNYPTFVIGYFNPATNADVLNPVVAGNRPKFVPKIKDFKGHALVADEMIQNTFIKQAHRDGLNVLSWNWSAAWVPLAMFKQEMNAVIAASPDGTGYVSGTTPRFMASG